jgi:hypothetical protein
VPQSSRRSNPRPAASSHPPRARVRPASPDDQVDALIGMLIENSKIMHELMGGDPRGFDFDAVRDRLYRIARSPGSTISLRYRRIARRLGTPQADPQAGDGGARPRRRLEPRPDPCTADTPPY